MEIEDHSGATADNSSMIALNDQGARGCEIMLAVNNAYQGTFLWRFGVLLAADTQAHTTDAHLPTAPPDEIAALAG